MLQEVAAATAAPAAAAPGQHSSLEPSRQQQQVAANNRKRTAEGLHAELASLDAVALWDPVKQRNLDAFFQRMAAASSGGHAEKAPKRHKPAWSAAAPTVYSVGHNNPRAATAAAAAAAANGGGDAMPGLLRAPSPSSWSVCAIIWLCWACAGVVSCCWAGPVCAVTLRRAGMRHKRHTHSLYVVASRQKLCTHNQPGCMPCSPPCTVATRYASVKPPAPWCVCCSVAFPGALPPAAHMAAGVQPCPACSSSRCPAPARSSSALRSSS